MTIQRTTLGETGLDHSRALLERLIARRLLVPERIGADFDRKGARLPLRILFEASDMSAHDFADEVAEGLA